MFEGEKPPILNDTERKKFYHNAPLIGNRKGFTTSWYDVDKVLEAQRDDTWQKASLIYEAKMKELCANCEAGTLNQLKIEQAKAEGAREIIDWVENNIKTICIYGEDFPKFEFDWQALKARFGGK